MKEIKKKLRILTVLIISLIFYTNVAGQGAYVPPDKPRLVVGIVVEQLRYDQIEKFRSRLSENGIRRLLNEGTYFQNASFDYMLTQSSPGYATISTGTEPALHGITSDSWYLPLKNELIYCTKDNTVNPVGGSYESGLHSPVNLQASTFSDELKMATNRNAKVFSVGIRESSAILSAGHSADGVFWYDNTSGTWMSSSYYLSDLPAWVAEYNSLSLPAGYLGGQWNLLRPEADYSECLADANEYEYGFDGGNIFPYDLKKINSKTAARKDFSLLRETPFSDAFTAGFAKKLIEKEKLGKDDVTDFVSVSFSSTDYIGHRFGPSSVEMGDAIYRLDKEIADLLTFLNDTLGKKNVLVYFTSTHGVSEIPTILGKNRIPAGYFIQNQALQLLRSYLNAIYGEGDWVKGYSERQIFLNRTLVEDARIPLEEIQKKVSRFLVQFSGVSSAYPYTAFEANDYSNGTLKKIVNSFSPQRSGDVIVTLNPGWVEKDGTAVTHHNSPWEYDSHVPLIWYGWSVNRATVSRKVNMTDIAVTLSTLCKVPFPNASQGEPLFEILR